MSCKDRHCGREGASSRRVLSLIRIHQHECNCVGVNSFHSLLVVRPSTTIKVYFNKSHFWVSFNEPQWAMCFSKVHWQRISLWCSRDNSNFRRPNKTCSHDQGCRSIYQPSFGSIWNYHTLHKYQPECILRVHEQIVVDCCVLSSWRQTMQPSMWNRT